MAEVSTGSGFATLMAAFFNGVGKDAMIGVYSVLAKDVQTVKALSSFSWAPAVPRPS